MFNTETACGKCGTEYPPTPQQMPQRQTQGLREDVARYPVLKGISQAYQALAWVWLLLSIIVAMVSLSSSSSSSHGLAQSTVGFVSIGAGIIGCLTFLAASEVLRVFLDIADNTRRAAEAAANR